mmetsp:Transcript_16300/g.35237  ORF Transcript_16300/g.35237 Transcript_16300/m.35237 type:complete len:633 (-) Transcript_16300:843-2741(-)|eukprot:CAMPEP_0202895732 /NCGR_PEP_ID=MMETSP1392-20130828/4884_1 /ASSEMBLY_ACC=CAM_ASM_000868 /TAXON_ID=225041 /ORGANISM="Chlamydomonas chlamydogama, Strain SAG 11-48b" /LENGTH=632 /DNA_ID=CAMNT_0049580855 /DNA_START=162 /DNA_END=2060 /DNA_ORIENTATION=-
MADDAASQVDTARTVVAIIAGALVVICAIVLVAVVGLYREKQLKEELARHHQQIKALQRDIDDKQKGSAKFATLDDLMKPYKKHLLQSAFDLQSRLQNQVDRNFMYTFKQRGPRDAQYAIESTTYFFAEFLSWLEVIRHQIVFVTGSEYAEALNSLLDSIRFQLTGETPFQGCKPNVTANDDTFDMHSDIMQLYIVDIRSIGNIMLHKGEGLVRPISVDGFLRRMKSQEQQDLAFQNIIKPLYDSIVKLADLPTGKAPIRRLAIVQVLLCKLIVILDNAVPWDCGPKFDSHEEPLYIQRDMRLTPMVKHLSAMQKKYLEDQVFFDDDPNLSFPGFREDLAHLTQAKRDDMLWPGACPPVEPRQRSEQYKKLHPYTQAGAGTMVGLRRRGALQALLPHQGRNASAGPPVAPPNSKASFYRPVNNRDRTRSGTGAAQSVTLLSAKSSTAAISPLAKELNAGASPALAPAKSQVESSAQGGGQVGPSMTRSSVERVHPESRFSTDTLRSQPSISKPPSPDNVSANAAAAEATGALPGAVVDNTLPEARTNSISGPAAHALHVSVGLPPRPHTVATVGQGEPLGLPPRPKSGHSEQGGGAATSRLHFETSNGASAPLPPPPVPLQNAFMRSDSSTH